MEFLVFVVIYAYLSFALQTIAKKTATPNEWLAWIPIASFYLMAKVAGKPGWWTILMLIPLVQFVFFAIVWADIAKRCNKPAWVGVLFIIPLVNLIIPGILAFSD